MRDSIKPQGFFDLQVFDLAGNLLEHYREENLVVSIGKTDVAKLLAGDAAGKKVSKIAVGTSATTPAAGDTALTGAFSKAVTGYSFPEGNSVLFSWSIEDNEANGMTIREFGLLTDDDTLFARKTRSDIVKTSAVRLVGTWKIVIN